MRSTWQEQKPWSVWVDSWRAALGRWCYWIVGILVKTVAVSEPFITFSNLPVKIFFVTGVSLKYSSDSNWGYGFEQLADLSCGEPHLFWLELQPAIYPKCLHSSFFKLLAFFFSLVEEQIEMQRLVLYCEIGSFFKHRKALHHFLRFLMLLSNHFSLITIPLLLIDVICLIFQYC